MEKAFEHAHFIWPAGLSGEDSYAEFLTSFEAPEEKAVCRISCDGDRRRNSAVPNGSIMIALPPITV